MNDTMVFENNGLSSLKLLTTVDNKESEITIIDSTRKGIAFLEIIEVERFEYFDFKKLKEFGYEETEMLGHAEVMTVVLDDKIIKCIASASSVKVLIKSFTPSFVEKQNKGFSSEKIKFIHDNYAKIFSCLIVIESNSNKPEQQKSRSIAFSKSIIYTALSESGFVLADVDSIKSQIDYTSNLMQAFTETELAESLFQKGLMVLSWGMTPYQYFIGFAEDMLSFVIDDKYKTAFYGEYKISETIKSLSLIKGELLNNFDLVKISDTPQLSVKGDGINGYYYLSLTLYLIDTDSFGEDISPICFFVLDSLASEFENTKPALNYNIFE